jgi:hypothetical protein
MIDNNILLGKANDDFNKWLLDETENDTNLHTFNQWSSSWQYAMIIDWLDTVGIYVGVFAGMYSKFNWNIQVKGTYKSYTNDDRFETRLEAYQNLFEKLNKLYNEGQLKQMI